MDSLNGVSHFWNAVENDASDSRYLIKGGSMENLAGVKQPLAANYDTLNMRYVFIHMLQIPDGTAL
jgi:hypothetical protein